MSTQIYEFEVDESHKGALYAWKWGDWKFTSRWTSDIAILADDDDKLARSGLAAAKNILLLAIPQQVVNPGLKKLATYRTLRILTFSLNGSGRTLLRKAIYTNVFVEGSVFKGIRESSRHDIKRFNFTEWILAVKGGVDVIKAPSPF